MPIDALKRQKHLLVLSVLALLALILWLKILLPHGNTLDVTILDVGQGDSIYLRTPSGRTMLIDGGGRADQSDADPVGLRVVEPFLRRMGTNRLDMVVLTHPHDDHLGGLCSVVRDFRVGMVLDSGIPHNSMADRRFMETIHNRRIAYHRARRGQAIDFGDGVKITVLNPPASMLAGTSDDTNNNSVVLRVTFGRSSMMLMGDAGLEAENDMLSNHVDAHADVLKVGHHGSDTGTGDSWLDAVHPSTAVISVGRDNSFGHPSQDVLKRLSERGIRTYRTDRNGAVMLRFTEDSFTAKSVMRTRE